VISVHSELHQAYCLVVPFVVVHVRCQVARVLLQVVPFVVGHVHLRVDEHCLVGASSVVHVLFQVPT
jgi:hypothetical protein